MSEARGNLRAIVLAAQRPGVANPLAKRFGVSHKCLIPLAGRPLIAHVLETVARHPEVGTVAISIEHEAFGAVERAIGEVAGGAKVVWVPAAQNLADSVVAAAGEHAGPFLITTADHPLLSAQSIDRVADALGRADAVLAMAPRAAVLVAHPEGQRRFYEFRDGSFSNCNLYGVSSRSALRAADAFRGGGQFAKSALRLVRAFGLANLVLLRLKMLDLSRAIARVSRRMGVTIVPVVLEDGSQAIDVDNDRTYGIVEGLLAARAGHAERAPHCKRRAS